MRRAAKNRSSTHFMLEPENRRKFICHKFSSLESSVVKVAAKTFRIVGTLTFGGNQPLDQR
jgi:hypothetical protein